MKKEGKKIENRRKTLKNIYESEEDNNNEQHWNNIEDEEANMDEDLNRQDSKFYNDDQEGHDLNRDYRLDKGETIRFVLKVPYNIENMCEMYGKKRSIQQLNYN